MFINYLEGFPLFEFFLHLLYFCIPKEMQNNRMQIKKMTKE